MTNKDWSLSLRLTCRMTLDWWFNSSKSQVSHVQKVLRVEWDTGYGKFSTLSDKFQVLNHFSIILTSISLSSLSLLLLYSGQCWLMFWFNDFMIDLFFSKHLVLFPWYYIWLQLCEHLTKGFDKVNSSRARWRASLCSDRIMIHCAVVLLCF